jgi:hypothetical protein
MELMEAKLNLRFEDLKSITFGSPVPLNLQVSDGRDDLTVYANIIKQSGESHSRVQLVHFSNGFYASNELKMPEVPLIFAQYVIEKNGQLLTDYEIVTETFYGKPPVAEEKWAIGFAVNEVFAEGFILGYEEIEA